MKYLLRKWGNLFYFNIELWYCNIMRNHGKKGRKMRLENLLTYNKIYIQCHDNPDADTIASGYALYQYFKAKGKDAILFYGGKFQIQKSNLKRQ